MHQKLQKVIRNSIIILIIVIIGVAIAWAISDSKNTEDVNSIDILEQPLFISSNDLILNIENTFSSKYNISNTKTTKVIQENDKYYSSNIVNISATGIEDTTDEFNITYKIGIDGGICDLAISVQTDKDAIEELRNIINIASTEQNSTVYDEIESVISSNTNDKITKQLGSKGRIEFISREITVDGLEFIPDKDHDAKVEEYKLQLIESGTTEDEVNSIDTSELFGTFKEYSKSKNLVILGINLNSTYMAEINRLQYSVANNSSIFSSGMINVLNNSTYQKFLNAIDAQDITINSIDYTDNNNICINSSLEYNNYNTSCDINIQDSVVTIDFGTDKFSNYDEFQSRLSDILKTLYNIEQQIEIGNLPDESEQSFEGENCKVTINIEYNSDDTYDVRIKSIESFKEV